MVGNGNGKAYKDENGIRRAPVVIHSSGKLSYIFHKRISNGKGGWIRHPTGKLIPEM